MVSVIETSEGACDRHIELVQVLRWPLNSDQLHISIVEPICQCVAHAKRLRSLDYQAVNGHFSLSLSLCIHQCRDKWHSSNSGVSVVWVDRRADRRPFRPVGPLCASHMSLTRGVLIRRIFNFGQSILTVSVARLTHGRMLPSPCLFLPSAVKHKVVLGSAQGDIRYTCLSYLHLRLFICVAWCVMSCGATLLLWSYWAKISLFWKVCSLWATLAACVLYTELQISTLRMLLHLCNCLVFKDFPVYYLFLLWTGWCRLQLLP